MQKLMMLVKRRIWNADGQLVEVAAGDTVEVSDDNAMILIAAEHAELWQEPMPEPEPEPAAEPNEITEAD